ncbi:MAG: DMT family transporter [Acidobacteria bacterium]|nr:MAG: DMT family transporter [Acidobacteriota bacterium]REK01270.1 MAG: DMT family transporter [Acidobacteriota bacterium]REK14226.1 MAG: DMT family transporter [Acidobacteriota bacterium]REK44941.1 MAG: DMT family transporter [Acidobacteriota bacterium]
MFLSTLSFALANVFVKEVSHLPVMEVVFFRCLVAGAFCVYGLKVAGESLTGTHKVPLVLRGLIGTLALALFFVTLQNIPLATAMVIQYLSPIFTAVIAIFFLKEGVKPFQWVFYAIAFSGVLFIGQVDARVSFLFVGLGILSAAGSGAAYNIVRSLRDIEHPLTVILYFQVIGVIAGAVSIPFAWHTPVGWDWFNLLMIGVFSQLGQVFLTNAFSRERAASVAIIVYTGLVYGIAIGWLYYGEAQTVWSLLGMGLVVAGVVASIVYVRKINRLEELEATVA